ncbi:MAG: hypothetical protein OWS74_04490, partial [Firmicutes bacterium]|nr:hypothetical protein [Bacillota bacterium]
DWPSSAFPLHVDDFQLVRSQRSSSLDLSQAVEQIRQAQALDKLSSRPEVASVDELAQVWADLQRLAMPVETREALIAHLQAAIHFVPVVDEQVVHSLHEQGVLSEERWQACFKGHKPSTAVLTVR